MIRVVEGIESTWHYHLRQDGDKAALCGKTVMPTAIPRTAWGTASHLRERWCETCREKARVLETSTAQ